MTKSKKAKKATKSKAAAAAAGAPGPSHLVESVPPNAESSPEPEKKKHDKKLKPHLNVVNTAKKKNYSR